MVCPDIEVRQNPEVYHPDNGNCVCEGLTTSSTASVDHLSQGNLAKIIELAAL
jgi:hypothetical protein